MIKNLKGIIGNVFQLGKDGPKIKNNSNTVEFLNSGETAKVNISVLSIEEENAPESWSALNDSQHAIVGTPIYFTSFPYPGIYRWCFGVGSATYKFRHYLTLKAGDYDFKVMGMARSNAGKVDWYINDSLEISGQDWYNSVAVSDVEKTDEITIPYSGKHILECRVNGKNASSSGYAIYLTRLWLTKQ